MKIPATFLFECQSLSTIKLMDFSLYNSIEEAIFGLYATLLREKDSALKNPFYLYFKNDFPLTGEPHVVKLLLYMNCSINMSHTGIVW